MLPTEEYHRNAALALLANLNSRVRFFYRSASNELDRTDEMTKIGRMPRRDSGEALFDATALTMTLSAMPEHAITIRASGDMFSAWWSCPE